MDDVVREKYRRLGYQLKDIIDTLDNSIDKLIDFKKNINSNYKINKDMAYDEDFNDIYDLNKDIFNEINNLYYIVNNKK